MLKWMLLLLFGLVFGAEARVIYTEEETPRGTVAPWVEPSPIYSNPVNAEAPHGGLGLKRELVYSLQSCCNEEELADCLNTMLEFKKVYKNVGSPRLLIVDGPLVDDRVKYSRSVETLRHAAHGKDEWEASNIEGGSERAHFQTVGTNVQGVVEQPMGIVGTGGWCDEIKRSVATVLLQSDVRFSQASPSFVDLGEAHLESVKAFRVTELFGDKVDRDGICDDPRLLAIAVYEGATGGGRSETVVEIFSNETAAAEAAIIRVLYVMENMENGETTDVGVVFCEGPKVDSQICIKTLADRAACEVLGSLVELWDEGEGVYGE